MIELPEAIVLANQVTRTLAGKRITQAVANQSPHKFAWYSGNPAEYTQKLAGKTITSARGVGCHVEISADDMLLVLGTPLHYHDEGEKHPSKHQLLLEFEDLTAMSATVQMWGGLFCFRRDEPGGMPDYHIARKTPSPLSDEFDRAFFDRLFNQETGKLSVKAFLATEQRIPGLGNGVLQDILWNAHIHPRRKVNELTEEAVQTMFQTVKFVLRDMTMKGGRDTERDLFGCSGGYQTILSKNSVGKPCPACGVTIAKEAYLGGSIYYCAGCQPL